VATVKLRRPFGIVAPSWFSPRKKKSRLRSMTLPKLCLSPTQEVGVRTLLVIATPSKLRSLGHRLQAARSSYTSQRSMTAGCSAALKESPMAHVR
jgi:hypothetical protein